MLRALFDEVLVPNTVHREVFGAGVDVRGIDALRAAFAEGWLTVLPVADLSKVAQLSATLDPGETEAIVLFEQVGASILLLDERRARAIAISRKIPVTGTVGVLQRAQTRGLIPAVSPVLHELRQMGFWLNARLIEQLARAEQPGAQQ